MNVHEVILITQNDQDMRAPAFEDYDKLCRLCLHPFELDTSRNIHEEEIQMNILQLIEVYTFVKIPEDGDNLPQNLCAKCLEFLVDMHMFRNRCRINNDLLLKVQQRMIRNSNREAGVDKTEDIILPPDEAQSLLDTINNKRMNTYECQDCREMYDNVHELRVHRKLVRHPRRRGSQCPHCHKMFTLSALKVHIRTHTGEKPYVCNVCGVAFAIKKNLIRHSQIHKERKQYICSVCSKIFTRTESLANHMKTHTENREQYLCSVCNRTYPSFGQLRMHLRYHNNSFLCNICGKTFTSKAYLITHTRMHTGEKPYVCHVCSKRFTGQSSLRNHLAVHDGRNNNRVIRHLKKMISKRPRLLEIAEIELSTTE